MRVMPVEMMGNDNELLEINRDPDNEQRRRQNGFSRLHESRAGEQSQVCRRRIHAT